MLGVFTKEPETQHVPVGAQVTFVCAINSTDHNLSFASEGSIQLDNVNNNGYSEIVATLIVTRANNGTCVHCVATKHNADGIVVNTRVSDVACAYAIG